MYIQLFQDSNDKNYYGNFEEEENYNCSNYYLKKKKKR